MRGAGNVASSSRGWLHQYVHFIIREYTYDLCAFLYLTSITSSHTHMHTLPLPAPVEDNQSFSTSSLLKCSHIR